MGNGMMGSMCAGGMGIGLLLGVLLLAAVGYVAYRLGRSQLKSGGSVGAPGDRTDTADEAVDVARKRYASGEISREEFEQLRRDLA
jgi:putative membrane protein